MDHKIRDLTTAALRVGVRIKPTYSLADHALIISAEDSRDLLRAVHRSSATSAESMRISRTLDSGRTARSLTVDADVPSLIGNLTQLATDTYRERLVERGPYNATMSGKRAPEHNRHGLRPR
jgi:hypothetical protein